MIRIIIVEDELAIARGLSRLITNNYSDFEVLDLCKNGRDGLQKILEKKPDIAFVDITMPVMSGLDMIEEAKKAGLQTRFVILTGYAEFEYARRAIHLGVSDYLLKPLDVSTLDDILKSCLLQQTSRLRLLRQEYLQLSVRSDKEPSLPANVMDGQNCVFIISFIGSLCASIYNETIPETDTPPLSADCLYSLEKNWQISIYYIHGRHTNEQVYAIVYPDTFCPEINSLADHIHKNLLQYGTWINTVVSPVWSKGKNISTIINDTYMYALLHNIFAFSHLHTCITPEKETPVPDNIQNLCSGILVRPGQDTLYQLIDSFLSCLKKEQVTQFQLTACIRYYISSIVHNYRQQKVVYPDAAELVALSHSYDELENELKYETDKLCGFRPCISEEKQLSVARQVRNYLDQNFASPITSKSFEQIFGYNRKYISALFKAEFGISPSKYVSELRLNTAKTLMQNNPDILTRDVAEMTGFSDAFYFSRVFKTHEGISPSQFMKRLKNAPAEDDFHCSPDTDEQ